jgi:hypothetical protein
MSSSGINNINNNNMKNPIKALSLVCVLFTKMYFKTVNILSL